MVALLVVAGFCSFNVVTAGAGAPGTWEFTGSMNEGRESSHTETLLPNGKVLITGGWGTMITASAEVYDPALGTFTPTGSMAVPRQGHTATLLPSGKVLIAGGGGNQAELYDPATGLFSLTGVVAAGRSYHTATLLPSGKVLIAGGRLASGITPSAEVYEPATGVVASFTMGSPRIGHTATVLPNGTVLLAGGYGGAGDLQSAELFDGSSFSGVGALFMNAARSSHTATLLPDGKVLVAGGGPVLAEVYDPAIGNYGGFTNTVGPLATIRYFHTATLLPNGKVLIAAGSNGSATYQSSAELYDPATRTFSAAGPLGTARAWHTATLLPTGKVLVAGGYSTAAGRLASAELYTPTDKGGLIIPAWPMQTPRYGHTATLLNNGKVLIAGGFTLSGSQVPLDSAAELYDPATGKFTYTADKMKRARHGHTATLLNNGKVLLTGGRDNAFDLYFPLASAELYDPVTDTFAFTTQNMVYSREDHTATLLPDGTVLVAGGYGYDYFNSKSQLHPSAEIFNPATGAFSYDSAMGTARRFHTATLLNNGEVLLAGGKGYDVYGNYVALNTAERYRPLNHSFAYAGLMSYARLDHTATLLPNGKVLVANDVYPELYDSTTQSFAAGPTMTTQRYRQSATLLQNGDVFFAGGESLPAPTTVRSSTEVYDTYFNAFSSAYPMDFPRKNHTATLLQSGKVLIAGGFGTPWSAQLYQPISYLPDLVVFDIAATPASPVAGQPFTVTVRVANQGPVAAGPFFIDFYKDRATPPAPGLFGDAGDAYCYPASLAAGATTECFFSVSYAAAGTYRMYAFADRENQQAEGSENNNIRGPQNLIVQPPSVSVTVASSPAGRQITVDGTPYTAPQTFSWTVGSNHTIGVASPQSGGAGAQFVYASWSDGGAQSHTITTPAAATTYTAAFGTQYLLTTAVSPSGTGSVSPSCPGGCWYNSGAAVSLTPTPATGYVFDSWSGDLGGSANPANLTMNAAKSVTANFTPPATPGEIVLDNAPAGQSGGGRSFTGTWCTSASTGPYGADSLYSCGAGADTYRWTPAIPAAGAYEVYVRWTAHANRSTAVPIAVTHAGGTSVKTYNQQTGGGVWVLHGTYDFSAGSTGFVQVSDTSGQACADAVKFVPGAALPLPLVTISATDATATEAGPTTGTFTVTRTGSTAAALTVNYTVSGTATPGSDYPALSGSVVIPIASATATITVTPVNDTLVEGDETVAATLVANGSSIVGAPGSATITITSDDVSSSEIVLDNAPAGVHDPAGGRDFSGTWSTSASSGFYGTDSLYSSGSGLDTYKFVPAIPTAGTYDVYVRWTAHANRSTTVPIAVTHAGGTTTRTFNQRLGGGTWTLHGTYGFNAGMGSSVQVSDANGQACADAVRFVPSAAPVEIVLDNASVGQAGGGRSYTGSWCLSTSAGFYGTDSLYSCGAGADTYRWTPTIPAAGNYAVYVRWTSHVNRSTAVPIVVNHAGGTTSKTYNQQAGGGAWALHGTYSFAAGTAGYVQVSDANGQACADAVRFVPVP